MSFLISLLSPILLTLLKPVVQALVDKLMEHLSSTFQAATISQAAGVAVLAAEEAAAYSKKMGTTMPPSAKLATAMTAVTNLTGVSDAVAIKPHVEAALACTQGTGATGMDTFSAKE